MRLAVPAGAGVAAALLLPGSSLARLGGGLIAAVAAAAPWWDRPNVPGLLLDVLACALGGLALGLCALAFEGPGAVALGTGVLCAMTLLLVWAWSLPLRALHCASPGRLVALTLFALAIGTPYLLVESPSILPAWVSEWNPLARLAGAVFDRDWFHGPTLYGRVGEAWYRYPQGFEGAMAPLLSGAAALLLGLILMRVKGVRGAMA